MKAFALCIIFLLMVISFFNSVGKEVKKEKPVQIPQKPVLDDPQPTPKPAKLPKVDLKPSYHASMTSLLSESIRAVYYILVNEPYEKVVFKNYHVPDLAVCIEFSNGKWLNWVWAEEGVYDKPEFQLSFSDERKIWVDEYATLVEVSKDQLWEKVIGKSLITFDLQFKTLNGNGKYLSEISLIFDAVSLKICGIQEPYPIEQFDPDHFIFSTDWILVKRS